MDAQHPHLLTELWHAAGAIAAAALPLVIVWVRLAVARKLRVLQAQLEVEKRARSSGHHQVLETLGQLAETQDQIHRAVKADREITRQWEITRGADGAVTGVSRRKPRRRDGGE